MIIYNVTINVENEAADEWLQWMKTTHIPEVLNTGCFFENKIYRVLADEDSGGKTYSVQYYCHSMGDYKKYEKEFASALRNDALQKFPNKFVAFRTLLEQE